MKSLWKRWSKNDRTWATAGGDTETLQILAGIKPFFAENRVAQLCLTLSCGESPRHGRAVGTNDSSVSVVDHIRLCKLSWSFYRWEAKESEKFLPPSEATKTKRVCFSLSAGLCLTSGPWADCGPHPRVNTMGGHGEDLLMSKLRGGWTLGGQDMLDLC